MPRKPSSEDTTPKHLRPVRGAGRSWLLAVRIGSPHTAPAARASSFVIDSRASGACIIHPGKVVSLAGGSHSAKTRRAVTSAPNVRLSATAQASAGCEKSERSIKHRIRVGLAIRSVACGRDAVMRSPRKPQRTMSTGTGLAFSAPSATLPSSRYRRPVTPLAPTIRTSARAFATMASSSRSGAPSVTT